MSLATTTVDKISGYLRDGNLTDLHGNVIGTYRITKTWPVTSLPDYQSFNQSVMRQVEAIVNGHVYKGRSGGNLFRGKLVNNRRTRA